MISGLSPRTLAEVFPWGPATVRCHPSRLLAAAARSFRRICGYFNEPVKNTGSLNPAATET